MFSKSQTSAFSINKGSSPGPGEYNYYDKDKESKFR